MDDNKATQSIIFIWLCFVRTFTCAIMIMSSHKRKRSLHDALVDLTKMQLAQQRLRALQEELSGIEETTDEMEQIMTHVNALQDILHTTKKRKLGCSSVSKKDLFNLGIERKLLIINRDALANHLQNTAAHVDQIKLLCGQIERIYRFVSMRFKPGARMILDAILLTVAEISADGEAQLPVAIFPHMRVATGDGVNIINPTTKFQLWLTGNVDYGLCTYKPESQRTRVLKAAIDDIMSFARNRITIVEGKREDQQLYDSMPEAISQAIALSEVTETNAVRFCLTDGRNWIFSLLTKDEQGNRVCYEGEIISIIEPRQDIPEAFQRDVQEVVGLLYHWLVASDDPMPGPLYTLDVMGG